MHWHQFGWMTLLTFIMNIGCDRISVRRTRITCVRISWLCCGAVTELMSGSWSGWIRWPCSDGGSSVPASAHWPPSTRPVATGQPKLQVTHKALRISFRLAQNFGFSGSKTVIYSLHVRKLPGDANSHI